MNPAASSALLQWIQIGLGATSLIIIFYGMFKILNRNNEEWRDRERRLAYIEDEIVDMRKDSREIIQMGANLKSLEEEMSRVRDRLDRFLESAVTK